MKIVYAMNSPRQLDFYIADKREAVPAGATLFAICADGRTIENQDEHLFAAISDEEYFTFRAMVSEAEQLEGARHQHDASETVPLIRRFFRRLLALLNGRNTGTPSVSGKFAARQANTVSPMWL